VFKFEGLFKFYNMSFQNIKIALKFQEKYPKEYKRDFLTKKWRTFDQKKAKKREFLPVKVSRSHRHQIRPVSISDTYIYFGFLSNIHR